MRSEGRKGARERRSAVRAMSGVAGHEVDRVLAAAIDHHRAGRISEAAAHYERVLQVSASNFDALNNYGLILKTAGHLPQAIELLRRAVEIAPQLADGHNNLGNALRAANRLDEALLAYQEALRLAPDDPEVHNNRGITLKTLGRIDDAVAAYRRAIALRPDFADAHNNLGNALRGENRTDAAISAFRVALSINPDNTKAKLNLAHALLEGGRPDRALAACDQLLQETPYHVDTLALKDVCLAETGRRSEKRCLVDFDRHIRSAPIVPPSGFDTIDAFNSALAEFVLTHPTLEHEPANHATINGWHSGDLLEGEDPCAAALKAMIDAAVRDHIVGLGDDASHPVVAHRPDSYSLRVWGIVMDNQGYQVSHVHPSGWLSGVYYVKVPSEISESHTENQGWIEFGRANADDFCPGKFAIQLIRPVPGMVVTFPSYVPHRTIPFDAHEKRISIAFDVIPDES